METIINRKIRVQVSELIKLKHEIWTVIIGPLSASNFQLIMGKSYDEAYQIIQFELTPLNKALQVQEHIFQHISIRNEIERLNSIMERHQNISPSMKEFFNN
jgi:hypothetical protein